MPWGKRDGEARATRVRLTEGGANPDRRSNLFTVTRRLHTVFKVMWHIFKLKLKVKVNLKENLSGDCPGGRHTGTP